MVKLYDHQKEAIKKLNNGKILFGGVGSGKSITALVYYFEKVCGGVISGSQYAPMTNPRDLYIITTARKRDTQEWDKEATNLYLSRDDTGRDGTRLVIDSWNNIEKYTGISGAFFIFDEQRVVGSGKWVKSFLSIAKKNEWILLLQNAFDIGRCLPFLGLWAEDISLAQGFSFVGGRMRPQQTRGKSPEIPRPEE